MKRFKISQLFIIYMFFAIYALTFIVAGCNNSSSSGASPSSSYLSVGSSSSDVISYIEKYGNDFEKSQSIESGKIYETMIWRSKGVSIKYLYDTGQIVKEEHFSSHSS